MENLLAQCTTEQSHFKHSSTELSTQNLWYKEMTQCAEVLNGVRLEQTDHGINFTLLARITQQTYQLEVTVDSTGELVDFTLSPSLYPSRFAALAARAKERQDLRYLLIETQNMVSGLTKREHALAIDAKQAKALGFDLVFSTAAETVAVTCNAQCSSGTNSVLCELTVGCDYPLPGAALFVDSLSCESCEAGSLQDLVYVLNERLGDDNAADVSTVLRQLTSGLQRLGLRVPIATEVERMDISQEMAAHVPTEDMVM